MTLAVTGATGQLGRLAIADLLGAGVAPADVVAVVRDPARAQPLAEAGVQVRVADYGDTTNVLKLPLAPVAYLMGTMIVIAAVIHLWLIFVPHRDDDGRTVI